MNKCLKTLSVAAVTVGVISSGSTAFGADYVVYRDIQFGASIAPSTYLAVMAYDSNGALCATNVEGLSGDLPSTLKAGSFSTKYEKTGWNNFKWLSSLSGYSCGGGSSGNSPAATFSKVVVGAYNWSETPKPAYYLINVLDMTTSSNPALPANPTVSYPSGLKYNGNNYLHTDLMINVNQEQENGPISASPAAGVGSY